MIAPGGSGRPQRRNVIERCFNRLERTKALAARYGRLTRHYQAMAVPACLRLRLP
ncbi:hypothetical protein SUDANB58_00487 [Streptomyces sp. enrichment culture]|uniref:hypothetical protein n=1 Tax=Streptomyces sp. enrichment culture TaxID=1795815 RepID=UPI003F553577